MYSEILIREGLERCKPLVCPLKVAIRIAEVSDTRDNAQGQQSLVLSIYFGAKLSCFPRMIEFSSQKERWWGFLAQLICD